MIGQEAKSRRVTSGLIQVGGGPIMTNQSVASVTGVMNSRFRRLPNGPKVPFLSPSLPGDTDSYKLFHELMELEGTTANFCYFAPRTKGELLNFFGLQPLIFHKLINNPVTYGDIDEMVDLVPRHIICNRQFLSKGWKRIVEKHGGYAPLHIRALKEGSIVPSHVAMFSVQSTDPEIPWLPGYIEPWTERLWAPITAGSKAWRVKKILKKYLLQTCDQPEEVMKTILAFMSHDFGCRGGDSEESVAIVGASLLQHFMGTDTIPALRLCRDYYECDCAGFSVPASEHAVSCAKGPEGEEEVLNKIWDTFAVPGGIVSLVGDTYSIMNMVRKIVRGMATKVMASGCKLVVRPDSSKNIQHTCQIVDDVLTELAKIFGATENRKGFRVLKDCIRLLWGDGNNEMTIDTILEYMMMKGWAAENMACFGIGGEYHAKMDRDTHKCAYKNSAKERDGKWYDTWKDPDTDPGKASYRGLLSTYLMNGSDVCTLRTESIARPAHQLPPLVDLFDDVYLNGDLLRFQNFEEIRSVAQDPIGMQLAA